MLTDAVHKVGTRLGFINTGAIQAYYFIGRVL